MYNWGAPIGVLILVIATFLFPDGARKVHLKPYVQQGQMQGKTQNHP